MTWLPLRGSCREAAERVGTEGNRLFAVLIKLRSVLTSYLAYSSKANSFRILIKTLHTHQWLKNFFRIFRTKAAFSSEITDIREKNICCFYWNLQ